MSKNYIVFDSMMVPPQKNIFLLLYCIIFDNKFLLILRNSKLLSINFLCVTLSHMSIGAGVVVTVTFQQVDGTPHAETGTQSDNQSLKNFDRRVEEFHSLFSFIIKRFRSFVHTRNLIVLHCITAARLIFWCTFLTGIN